jgi:hypothetical protein
MGNKITYSIIYDDGTSPYNADCTNDPQVTFAIESDANADLIVKHNNHLVRELHLDWIDGADQPFSLHADYTAHPALSPRVRELKFEYSGTAGMLEPSMGGMTWSRSPASYKLTFVFYPLGELGIETEGVWRFNPSQMPPIKLKVIVARKTDEYAGV